MWYKSVNFGENRALAHEIGERKSIETALGVRMSVKFPRLTNLCRLCSWIFYVDPSVMSQHVAFLVQDDSPLK